jgi:sec-independent protein translocase protein TatB
MFDIAPTELLLVGLIALVVIGPKDLPRAMRFVGKWIGKARGMARHFRSGLDTMMREAELEELEKQWRQQNEEIMRQYPRVDAPVPATPNAVEDDSEHLMRPTAATPDAPAAPPKGPALP